MSRILILLLLEITGYTVKELLEARKNSSCMDEKDAEKLARNYSSAITNGIKQFIIDKYGYTSVSSFIDDNLTIENVDLIRSMIAKKMQDKKEKKLGMSLKEIEDSVGEYFKSTGTGEFLDDDILPDFLSDVVIGFSDYVETEGNHDESTKCKLNSMGVF